jgi:hypothetical protein
MRFTPLVFIIVILLESDATSVSQYQSSPEPQFHRFRPPPIAIPETAISPIIEKRLDASFSTQPETERPHPAKRSKISGDSAPVRFL